MGNRNKLLNKSLKVLVGYAAIVLACSIPVYYAITDYIWQTELHEHNLLLSQSVKQNLKKLIATDEEFSMGEELDESIAIWNKMQPEMQLKKAAKVQPDSVYNTYRKSPYSKDIDRFQGLVTYVELGGKPYSLTVESNIEEADETILALTWVTLAFFSILLLGFILLNRRISRKIWKPFYQSLAQIRAFDLHSQQPLAFEPTDVVEFGELNASLEKLVAGNIAVYQQQKEFTENASHELQTPLAILQTKLDLLRQNPLNTTALELIEQMQKALSRASRTNKNLLLLAKIENRQFPEKESVKLSELLAVNMELVQELAEEKQLKITQDICPGIHVNGNRILLEVLLSNLLLNAIRHTLPKGNIAVNLSKGRLEIANTGKQTLNPEKLFKRFGTVASLSPGTGLGLALVQQISQQHGWEASYVFENGFHKFKVSFEPLG